VQHENGKELIVLDDPEGYHVTLNIDTWETHIVVRHPEVKPLLDVLKRTIEEPELIQRAGHGRNTFFYYRITGRRTLRRDDLYLSVVVERDNHEKSGVVKTAYLVRRPRKDGKIIWLKRT